jgi:small subunit ribosomal protein S17
MNERRRMTGIVTSNKMMKTVVVMTERSYRHPLYGKVVHATHKVKAHDELGCAIGDTVIIVESARISREKAWVVQEIVKKEVKSLNLVEEVVE